MKFPTQLAINNAVNCIRSGIACGNFPSIPCKTTNHFSDNIYCRELHIPKGTYIIGKKHSTRHLNIILKGECYLWTMQEKIHGKQGMIWESLPGIQKVCYAITDVSYLTIHYNPENDTSEEVLEGKYIQTERQLDMFPELNLLPWKEEMKRIT
jgi:quercetin dioxygenase-like cupin family protein